MEFNPFSPEFKRDPYASYDALRREDPVHQTQIGIWTVARYDDVVSMLKNHQVFSSAGMMMNINGRPTRTVINTDPPVHTRMRNIVNRAFTPKMVADMEPRIREITTELLDRVMERGTMDFVDDLAIPLPVTVIAEILGVDPQHGEDFKRWSNAVVGGSSMMGPAGAAHMEAEMQGFRAYFQAAIDERRREPQDDLISAVVRATEGDDPLSPDEVLAFTSLLLIAGNETTTNLIGNAMLALLEHPEQFDALRADPSLIPNMVEEALRYESPVQFIFRRTTQDAQLAGKTIPAGATVLPMFASANRDGEKFPEPDTFDIRRNTQGHVAFGHGIHFCLGAPLARLEARVAFEEVLRRMPKPRLDGAPQRLDSFFLRGMAKLPLAFEPAPVAAA